MVYEDVFQLLCFEKLSHMDFRAISNPFCLTFVYFKYFNLQNKNPVSTISVSCSTKSYEKKTNLQSPNLCLLPQSRFRPMEGGIFVLVVKKCVHLSVYQSKKENIQKLACSPIVQVRSFEHSSRLLFIPNRAKALFRYIIS